MTAGLIYLLTINGIEDAAASGDLDLLDVDGLTIESSIVNTKAIIGGGSITDRIVESTGPLTLNDITLQDGSHTGVMPDDGGACLNHRNGNLTLTRVLMQRCILVSTSSDGGALLVDFDSAGFGGMVDITDTTFRDSVSPDLGGGAFIDPSTQPSIVNITRSTFSGNMAADDGGGIYFFGAADPLEVNIVNSTFSGNNAVDEGGGLKWNSTGGTLNISYTTIAGNGAGEGGGLWVSTVGSTIDLQTSILADNTASVSAPDCGHIVGTDVVGSTAGHNLFETNNCDLAGIETNNLFVDPGLGPLADNGGFTETHAIGTGDAPAHQIVFGTAGCGTSQTEDQRGSSRPGVGASPCDMGAFEALVVPVELQSFSID